MNGDPLADAIQAARADLDALLNEISAGDEFIIAAVRDEAQRAAQLAAQIDN